MVQTILKFLAAGDNPSEILKNYPSLQEIDIQAALNLQQYKQTERNYSIQ